jgi:hypothetical protein
MTARKEIVHMETTRSETSSAGRHGVGILFRFLLLVLSVLLVGSLLWNRLLVAQLSSAKNQIAAMQRETEIQAWADNLSAPSEVILCDYRTLHKIEELRGQAWEADGIKTFMIYNNIMGATHGLRLSSDPTAWHEASIAYVHTSYEREVQQRLGGLCKELARQMQENKDLGLYFNQNKGEFDRRIRPLLLRLLKCRSLPVAMEAADALLAAGDRSEQVIATMRSLAVTDEPLFVSFREDLDNIARKYGVELAAATAPATATKP